MSAIMNTSTSSRVSRGLRTALSQYSAPWQFEMVERFSDETDAISISDANGSSIAEMQCPRDVEEALARLMSAAPQLLAALRECMKDSFTASDGMSEGGKRSFAGKRYTQAVRAIEDAEGKQ